MATNTGRYALMTLGLAAGLGMLLAATGLSQASPSQQLADSVHADLECSACHPGGADASGDASVEVDDRACTDCHQEAEPYWKSIHGRAREEGVAAAATCADCHGSHDIQPIDAESSPVHRANLPQTCGECHQNSEIAERYGVPANRYETYMDSYHGIFLSESEGEVIAADCTSCHGDHLILAQSNPQSTIHPANLPETCGQCHPNAGESFTKGKVHVQADPGASTGVWIVRVFYTVFIAVLGIFFIGHILLDATRWLRRRYGH